MAKGYWIVHVDVTDMDTYGEYRQAAAAALDQFGGRFLVRGGEGDVVEGTCLPRHVVVEFDSYDQAKTCYNSPVYQAAKSIRVSASNADLVIVEGYDG